MCTIKVSAVILLLCVISLEAQNLLMITTGDLSNPFYSSDLKNTKYNSTRSLNLNKLLQGNYNQPNYEYSTILEDDSGSSVQSVGEEKSITREDNIEPRYLGHDPGLRTVAEFYFINLTNRASGQKKISDSSNINDYINSTFSGLQSNEIFQTDANKNFTQVISISNDNQEKPHDFQPQSSKLNENSKISVKIEKISNSPSQNSKNVTNSTESLFPISINFSINSKQDNSSYSRSLPSIEHEFKDVGTTITLSTTTLQESNNNKDLDSNQKKEFTDIPINNNRQLFVPVTIELPSNSRSSLDKVHNISYSQIENKKELSNNRNILLLKSNYNYSAELPQNNSDERSNGLTKAILKNVLNVKSKSKNNSLIFVKLSPVNLRPLNFDFVEKSTDYQSSANKPQENITLSHKLITAIFPSNCNLSQNNNDHMGAIKNISTNDSITEVAESNANKQISSVTISLFPNYTLQSTGNSKIEIRSGIFHDNKDNYNKDILSSDQMRHSLIGESKAKENNPSNLTEPIINQVPSKSITNNKIYHHVFHSNDSQVTINNMVNGNSSLMEVVIESNLKEASKLQSKQNILNSSETQFEFDSNRSPLPTETNTAVIQQSKLKNVLNTGQVNARIKGDVLVKLALNNSDILKVAKIEGKSPGIISINLNHSQKSINPEVDTSNNYQKGYEGKSLVASTEKLTVPTGEMLDNFSSSISSLSTTLNQHSSPSVPNSILLQKVEEIINNDPITIYYPKKSLISKMNDNREEDVIQDYIDSYGTSNLNIVLNHPKGIPEIVLNDHFFTSEEKLLITTSQGDKLIIRKENEENDAKNNLKKDNLFTQIQEIKNISENANVEGFDEKGGIQSIAEDIYIHTGVNKEKSVRILTRRYRNEDRGPLWWVSTDEGFAPEGAIPASTGFILKIENDEPGQGFKVDDILRK